MNVSQSKNSVQFCFRKWFHKKTSTGSMTLLNDRNVDQLTIFEYALWLDLTKNLISPILCRFSTQEKAQTLFRNQVCLKMKNLKNCLPVVAELGGKIGQKWQLPKIIWKDSYDIQFFPSKENIHYKNHKLLNENSGKYKFLTKKDVIQLFNALKASKWFTWSLNKDFCHGRAELASLILVAMNIDSEKVKKITCFSKKLINNWSCHISTCVIDKKWRSWVLDPATTKKAVIYLKWVEKISVDPDYTIKLQNELDLPMKANHILEKTAHVFIIDHNKIIFNIRNYIQVIPTYEKNSFFLQLGLQKIENIVKQSPILFLVAGPCLRDPAAHWVAKSKKTSNYEIALEKLKKINNMEYKGPMIFPSPVEIESIPDNSEIIEKLSEMLELCRELARAFMIPNRESLIESIDKKLNQIPRIKSGQN